MWDVPMESRMNWSFRRWRGWCGQAAPLVLRMPLGDLSPDDGEDKVMQIISPAHRHQIHTFKNDAAIQGDAAIRLPAAWAITR